MAKKISEMPNLMGFVLLVELIYLIILFVVGEWLHRFYKCEIRFDTR